MASPLRRHPANPILTAEAFGDGAVLAFNPAVTRFAGRWLMIARLDLGVWGDPHIVGTRLGFAWSDDGVRWEIDTTRRIDRSDAIEMLQPLEPHRDLERELWRIYDPRLTVLDTGDGGDSLVLTFAADTTQGLRPGIATSSDAQEWCARWLGPPADRNNVVFPELIRGRWWRLHRPMHDYGGAALGAGRYGIWTSTSLDGDAWGTSRFLGDGGLWPFGNDKVGPGAPPIRTNAGWLCLTHTVSVDALGSTPRGWEPDWSKTYCGAAMLLDLDDPSRVIATAIEPLLEPRADYERSGYRHDVVFPTAAVVDGDELRVYYGAADTVVAMATAKLDDVVDWVISDRRG